MTNAHASHSPTPARGAGRRAGRTGLTDSPGLALDGPGSTSVSCLLMQDAVAADTVSVAPSQGGSLTGKAALFANPFLKGKEEALIVDDTGHLSYLQRDLSSTGWAQTPVGDNAGAPLSAAAVVVVVHPIDLSVWAIYSPGGGGQLQALRLIAPEAEGTGLCSWQAMPGALPDLHMVSVTLMSVSYESGRSPRIFGLDTVRGDIIHAWPTISNDGIVKFGMEVIPQAVAKPGSVEEFIGGADYRAYEGRPAVSVVCYALAGGVITRYTPYSEVQKETPVAAGATGLVGVYPSFLLPDVGCLYLDGTGRLVSWNLSADGLQPTMGIMGSLNLSVASSWLDADQMLHVYGLVDEGTPSRPGFTLKVLHQKAWGYVGQPEWSATFDNNGFAVPQLIGLTPVVAAFALDPFPDYRPSLLVHRAATAEPANQFTIDTQDVASGRWSRDRIRLPHKGAPHFVSHYVSTVTMMDGRGAPMAGLDVDVSAETTAEIRIDGASYLVGPGHRTRTTTNGSGKLTIAVPATSLLPATLRVDAVGLEKGLIIQPATAVHDYLSGTGTLSSQNGLFDADGVALYHARAGEAKTKIVGAKSQHDCAVASGGIQDMFKLANGQDVQSRVIGPTTPTRAIHGFVIGRAAEPDAGTGQHALVRTEFADDAEMTRHLTALRAHPAYGGIAEDFEDVLQDVAEGVESGAVSVFQIVVHAGRRAVKLVLDLGGEVVEFGEFVVDSIESAVYAVQAVFRLVVDEVGKVVDWLKALFRFDHILNTAAALDSGLHTIVKYTGLVLGHYKKDLHGWFQDQEETIRDTCETLKRQYLDRPPGDARNLVPALTDAGHHAVAPADVHDNPQAQWLFQRVIGPEGADSSVGPIGNQPGDPMGVAFAEFMADLEKTGLHDEIGRLLADIGTLITEVVDPADPQMAAKASMTAVIDLVEQGLSLFLQLLDTVVQTAISWVQATVDGLDTILNVSITGPLDTLYQWIQNPEGAPGQDVVPLTLGRLLCLMGGFAITVGWKLMKGVDSEPFPKGEFVYLPVPSWGTKEAQDLGDFDPGATQGARLTLGSLSMVLGTACNSMADVMPISSYRKDKNILVGVAGGNALFTATASAILAYPWLNGKTFEKNPAAGAAFAIAGFTALASWGTLGLYLLGDDGNRKKSDLINTPAIKNLAIPKTVSWKQQPVSLGPVLMGLLAISRCVCEAKDDPPNAFDIGLITLRLIPGLTEFLRIGIKTDPVTDVPSQFDAERALLAVAVDMAAGLTNGLMVVVPAGLDGPAIPEQSFPPGTVGQEGYLAPVDMTGAHVYNSPLHWSLAEGKLPLGLEITPETGQIHGTVKGPAPTKTFKVQVQDSYSPPRTATSPDLKIDVH